MPEDDARFIRLTRFGATDTETSGFCEKYFFGSNTYPTKLTVATEAGYGIVGVQILFNNFLSKTWGDVELEEGKDFKAFEFTARQKMIGFEGVSGPNHVKTIAPISVLSGDCVPEELPPLVVLEPIGIISNATNI